MKCRREEGSKLREQTAEAQTAEAQTAEELRCIQAVIAGQLNRYQEIVEQYQGMVYRVCLKMTSDPSIAEELTQEVFVKAYTALASYRQEAKFSTWLYQITVRKCLDFRRKQVRESNVRSHDEAAVHEHADWRTPEHELIRQEQKFEVLQLIQSLKEPYRTVVKLYYFEQCTYQEIASQLQTPVRTVESQLYRAKKMMKRKGGSLI